jgi:flagellar basal body-associated protein FliL
MESQPQSFDASQSEPKKSGIPTWLIILIAVPVVCFCLAVVVIAVLTIMGPVIGNVFSSINQSLH